MTSVLVVSAYLLITVTRVEITALHHTMCRAQGYRLLEAKFGREVHLLCLKLQPIGASHLTSRTSTLYLEPVAPGEDPQTVDSDIQTLVASNQLSDITMAYGFPVKDPSSGSAEGYIGDDHQFYGLLHMGNRTLHADPYDKDDLHKFFGAFENDKMAVPRSRRDHAQYNVLERVPYLPFRVEARKKVPGVARARICDLLLLADKEFYLKDAKSSLNHVVQRMMHTVSQADIIFRNADFDEDGIPDNIGFSVKYILVLTSEDTNRRVFGDLLTQKTIDGRAYLMQFARLRRLSEVCLGVAFSGHAFPNRTLGLSFTSLGGNTDGGVGGLCDRRAYGRSFNTLAIVHATTEDTGRVPDRIAALTLAHEMGHSFGAQHDDTFANPECSGYLMGSQSSSAINSLNFEFSVCSKRLIASTLSSMSYCLVEEDRPFCGNGIVEEGESCDCGMPSWCSQKDPCCTPRSGSALVFQEGTLHKDGCSVAPSAMCHPSQGRCCTENCQLVDLLKSGIDCRTQDQECTCSVLSASCRCGLNGRCLSDGTCHAAECATLGLKECHCVTKYKSNRPRGFLQGSSPSELNMCGICCEVPMRDGRNQCIPAEEAAWEKLANNSALPDFWPDEDYKGPNVTVRLCEGYLCNKTTLRAWPPGSVCVSQNVVGMCSAGGICKMQDYIMPRSNVYPYILEEEKVPPPPTIKLLKKASETIKPVSIIFIYCLVLLCLIK